MTYRCTGGFAVPVGDGQMRVVSGGELVGDDDPILQRNPAAFERVETYTARRAAVPQSVGAVETATAGPGEVRQTSVSERGATTTRKGESK